MAGPFCRLNAETVEATHKNKKKERKEMAMEMCVICRDVNKPDPVRRKLNFINALLRNEATEEGSWFLNWGIRFRCRYGVGCPKLDVARSELECLARGLNPKMRHFALHASDGKFGEMLHVLQGDFPSVYRQMRIWRAEKIKSPQTSYVKASMGGRKDVLIPLEEYRDLKASQYGYEDYEDLRKNGLNVSVPDLYDQHGNPVK